MGATTTEKAPKKTESTPKNGIVFEQHIHQADDHQSNLTPDNDFSETYRMATISLLSEFQPRYCYYFHKILPLMMLMEQNEVSSTAGYVFCTVKQRDVLPAESTSRASGKSHETTHF